MARNVSRLRVLVVEDELLIRWAIAETLSDAGHVVIEAADAAGAVRALANSVEAIDVVALDYRLPDSRDLALLAAIVISFASRLNVGIAAIPLAWAVGAFAGHAPDAVLGGFPASLFVTLSGVTLLFALAEENGTIGNLATRLAALAATRAT